MQESEVYMTLTTERASEPDTPRVFVLTAAFVGGLLLASPAHAGPILTDIWYEFGFGAPGTSATGCFPADPAADACVPSSGTPTTFIDTPPWTFNAAAGGATLTVTDAFESGDQFEVLDFGVPLGFTSAAGLGSDCGDDPVTCLADANFSHGFFLMAAGNHSITIAPSASPFGSGAAYLILEAVQTIPEPGTLVLFGTAAAATFWRRRHRQRA
jgi:hypothetical protein